MKLTFLGTGTSHGVPVIACKCKVCRSLSKKDKRNRCSVYIQTDDDKYILIDIGPEFRIQALKYKVNKVDAVLLTHSHADHFHGIDDLRIFSAEMFKVPENKASLKQYNAPPIPIYTNKATLDDLHYRFAYFFMPVKQGGGVAKIELKQAEKSFDIGNTQIIPVPMMHGNLETVGWLLIQKSQDGTKHSIAYLTDCNYISEESFKLINENCGTLEQLIIDGLRIKEHSTHFSFLQAMEAAQKLHPKKVWFTHLTHQSSHRQVIRYIKQHKKDFPDLFNCAKSVLPAYDGLVLKI